MNINRLTKEQAAIIGCFTGIACGPFSDVHEIAVVQRRVDDPVKTTTPPLIGSQWSALITERRRLGVPGHCLRNQARSTILRRNK